MAALALSRWRIFIGVLVLVGLYLVHYHYHSNAGYRLSTHALIPSFVRGKSSKYDFVNTAIEVEVSDPFDVTAISQICLNRQPRNDVVISCSPGTGGVGNIRSYMLHCIRFAMEAGAPVLLPHFLRRSPSDLADLSGVEGDFEHFFDRQHFVDVLQAACPHMMVYDHPSEQWTIGNIEVPHWPLAIDMSSLQQPSPWRAQFDQWFEENTVGMRRPVVLTSGDPGRDKAVMDDGGMGFYYNFGRILRFRPDARRLAATCIAAMNEKFSLNMDPKLRLYKNAYLSAHLRTASDAVKAGWHPDFEGQTDNYINQTLHHGLRVIYAASGNDEDLQAFKAKALLQGIHVVDKRDLLSGNDLRELNNMLWDQRGLIDFEVLLKASQFGGYARSSFSHNIAFRRHFLSSAVQDPFADPLNHFSDELSVVYGRFDAAWEAECVRTMWP